ncbi:uncharacterized protein LOC129595146 isoform X1 [Paramacrobiotus metropolitanus]|uniref:uncharacterized protein LOC129595146 isoform X1 n=1 Tax=Paramacrobiotus metropolitanus TaxID=2943436 RepID=UPI002445B93F|nr:uncharacterized protein LOC129595146 isoform X1 [Paramacrobiotus metropolitanus]
MAENLRIYLLNTTLASIDQETTLNFTSNMSDVSETEWQKYVPGTGAWSASASAKANLFYIVCYPILLALCTIGNSLNLTVLFSEKRKTSTNCYMTAMAVGDLVYVWARLLRYNTFASRITKISYNHNASDAVYPFVYYAQKWSTCFSDWVLIAFSLERLAVVFRPLQTRWLVRPLTARCVIVGLFILAGILHAERFVTEHIRYINNGLPDAILKWLLPWTDTIDIIDTIVILGNFFGVLLIDSFLIAAIKRQENSAVGKMRSIQATKSTTQSRNSNIVLLADVGLYLFSSFPNIVYTCLLEADNYQMFYFHVTAQIAGNRICTILQLCNYSLRFFLYLMVSQKYRNDFVKVFGPLCCPAWTQEHWKSLRAFMGSWLRGKGSVTPSKLSPTLDNKSNGHPSSKKNLESSLSTATVTMEMDEMPNDSIPWATVIKT